MNDERTGEADEVGTSGRPGARIGAGAVIEDAAPSRATDPATAARVDAWLLGAASTGRRSGGTSDGNGRGPRRRVLLASAAVMALAIGGVLVLTRDKRETTSATRPSALTTPATAPTPVIATTAAATSAATSPPVATTATSVVATTAGSTTAPASTIRPSTTATTLDATTVAPTSTAPEPLTDAELFQSLVDGSYPTGQAWPHGSLTGGGTTLVVGGVVPDEVSRTKILAVFDPAPNGAKVVDNLAIDPRVPVPGAALWTIEGLDSSAMFAPGSTELANPDGLGYTASDALLGLWAKRLVDVPSARLFAVVRRDDASGTLATSRANAIRLRFQSFSPKLENSNQVIPVVTGAPSSGAQVAFAQLVAP